MANTYDSIIIGAGQAGPPLAERLSQAGDRVAILERERVGGTCVNYGCIPTKALVASARAAHMARRGDDFGVVIGGDIGVDGHDPCGAHPPDGLGAVADGAQEPGTTRMTRALR